MESLDSMLGVTMATTNQWVEFKVVISQLSDYCLVMIRAVPQVELICADRP